MKKLILSVLASITFSVSYCQLDTSKIKNIPQEVKKELKKDTSTPKMYYIFPLNEIDLNNLFEIIKNGTWKLDLKPSQQDSIFNAYKSKIGVYDIPKVDTTKIKPKK